MRILFLSKRQYMGKDLIDDRYGRFYELPEYLASQGHQVIGRCLAYHARKQSSVGQIDTPSGVTWLSWDLPPVYFDGLLKFHRDILASLKSFRPDVIVGCSDAFQVIYANWLGKKYCIPILIDLYDQFEAYGSNHIPGLQSAYRHAIKNASGVTCISEPLRRWVASLRNSEENTFCLGNAVDTGLFRHFDKYECRKNLGLPIDAKLIGTAGALTKNRDIESLYRAYAKLAELHTDIHLVIAGVRDTPPPAHPNVHDLGQLDHSKIPLLFNALDVGVICNRNSLFAQYCHPQKFLEMQACNLPTIAARVGIFALEDGEAGTETYIPEDPDDLVLKLLETLSKSRESATVRVPTWHSNARLLEGYLLKIIET